ncbi:MAG: tRNA (adenosine(37)-N6)-dimethylallyltransferase MiaA [Puniceicoccales bacterium]|jgi:tRNA dimethylallyltransferase|nr:tRNA (adenosine(37)-N6)-dimethylallyltransferase MiaA [Puniceicoccales bacterium]
MDAPTLHIITGPTATGKTAFAMEWARAHGAEIVSCDSLLVYRGMDIGTAKPTPEERAAVPHHCIDLVEPDAPYSVSGYIRDAAAAIQDIIGRGRQVVVTGGSGFYLKAFYQAVTDAIAIPESVLARVQALQAEGLAAMQAALEPYAPGRPDILDWQNPRRVAKALERCMASGRSLPELHAAFRCAPGAFAGFARRTVLLEREPEVLRARIVQRVHAMLDAGLIGEVERLRTAGKLRPGTPAASAVGYRETLSWLDCGGADRAALASAVVTATCQLAAKQRKWFRTQISVDEVVRL